MIPLTSTPNEPRCITDDTEAKLILVEVGLLEKLLEYAKHAPSLTEPYSARIYCTNHPTHWLVADYLTGFADPKENGFVIECVPKSRCSLEQFRTVQRKRAAQRFPNGVEHDESGHMKPDRN